ncbi:MAG: FGGY-family carbohydrate kinase, partial [Thioalkalispiraceae bacterium]
MPTSSPYFLGIDLGTSGCRGIVINQQQQQVAKAHHVFEPTTLQQGLHQQNAESWWQALGNVFAQLAEQITLKNVVAISIDATSGSVLLCDTNGRPLHDALMYNDKRACNEARQLQRLHIDNAAVLSPSSGLAKLLWLKQQAFSREARYFLHQADWLNGKLLKRFGDTDTNNALKSGYDPVKKRWPDYFAKLGINKAWLPRVHQPGEVLGKIDKIVAQQLGLNPETRLIAGTTDSTAAIIATGINQV